MFNRELMMFGGFLSFSWIDDKTRICAYMNESNIHVQVNGLMDEAIKPTEALVSFDRKNYVIQSNRIEFINRSLEELNLLAFDL